MGGNGRYKWDSANGPRIIVGPNSDKYTLANEQAHAESDSRGPGGFDGIGHKKNGDVMTPLENEADSDAASIEEAEKDLKALGGCDSFCEQLVTAGCYFLPARKFQYEQRKKALDKANELIKQGRLDEAREALKKYPVYQRKIPIGPSVK